MSAEQDAETAAEDDGAKDAPEADAAAEADEAAADPADEAAMEAAETAAEETIAEERPAENAAGDDSDTAEAELADAAPETAEEPEESLEELLLKAAGDEPEEAADSEEPGEAVDFMADGLHKANGQIDEEALLAKVRLEEAELFAEEDAAAADTGMAGDPDLEEPKRSAGARLKDFLLGKDL